MSRPAFRYGAWAGGADPLEPPYDVAAAVDEIGQRVMDGASPRQALRELMRRGTDGLRGLDQLRQQVARRQREARRKGQLDGTLQEVRELLDKAVELEQQALFPDPSDAARMAELELDSLPQDTARAVQQLRPYEWRSPEARETFEQIDELLRKEVLDSQFRGMKQALESADPAAMQAIKDMLADLNAMLRADARGEHTQEQFDAVHGQARRPVPVEPQGPRGAGRRPRPSGRGPAAADGLADPAAAAGAGRADGGGARPRPAGAARRAR